MAFAHKTQIWRCLAKIILEQNIADIVVVEDNRRVLCTSRSDQKP